MKPTDFVVHHKKQAYDVFIARPSVWSNPFSSKPHAAAHPADSKADALYKFSVWVLQRPEFVAQIKEKLKGKILGCWCSPSRCHGELLAAIANNLPLPDYAPQEQPLKNTEPKLF